MTPERIAELKGLRSRDDEERPWRTMMVDDIDDLLATAEREAKLREAAELLLSVVVDAICRGMPVTQQVADARNKAVAALETKGGDS